MRFLFAQKFTLSLYLCYNGIYIEILGLLLMTLIECFTDSHIDNIAACLRLRPDHMIFVGNADEMSAPVKRYRKLLKQRGIHTEITLCDVRKKDIGDICSVFARLIQKDEEYVIDLTGGDEPVIMAVGAVYAGLDERKRQRIRVEKYDHNSATLLDCIHDNRPLPCKQITLTVEEMIRLHGGSLLPSSDPLPQDCSRADLDKLWSIVSAAPKRWNSFISTLNQFENHSDTGSEMQTHVPLDELRSLSDFDEKETLVRDYLKKLRKHQLIDDRSSDDELDYTYCSELLRYCTRKAGNVLEVKTLLEGRSVLENGAPLFHDCRMSVSIDWDGIPHDPSEGVADTCNEIDVMLMHGATPLFISCKNGGIGDGELYKLHTVATRFGGPHARKMLVATSLDQSKPASRRSIAQRAWDMDILLVTDAAKLPKEGWRNLFKQALQ